MARVVLKANNKILKSGTKIFVVGELRPPVFDYDPNLITGVSDNTAIGSLLDSSTQGLNLSQLTETAKPKLRTNFLNNHHVVEFDGTNDYFSLPVRQKVQTVFLIVQHTGNLANIYSPIGDFSSPCGWNGNLTPTNLVFNGNNSVNASGFRYGTYNKIYVNNSDAFPVNEITRSNAWVLLTLDIPSGTHSINLMGADNFNSTGGAANVFFPGRIARLIGYDYRLPQIDRKNIIQGLLTKYAL